jgi:hypothetical protein
LIKIYDCYENPKWDWEINFKKSFIKKYKQIGIFSERGNVKKRTYRETTLGVFSYVIYRYNSKEMKSL